MSFLLTQLVIYLFISVIKHWSSHLMCFFPRKMLCDLITAIIILQEKFPYVVIINILYIYFYNFELQLHYRKNCFAMKVFASFGIIFHSFVWLSYKQMKNFISTYSCTKKCINFQIYASLNYLQYSLGLYFICGFCKLKIV